jgi:transcriptional regulator with XRE-family HTH domain
MPTDTPAATLFKEEFIARTKQARKQAGLSQQDMSDILGIEQGTYKQYEVRSPLPHQYVTAFCAATHVTTQWLFTGRQRRIAAE